MDCASNAQVRDQMVEQLGKDQPEYLAFKDRHGNEIGDIEITGVDSDEALQNVDEPTL